MPRSHENTLTETLEILYRIECDNGDSHEYRVVLDAQTLDRLYEPEREPPEWARVSGCDSESCQIQRVEHRHCPVALALVDVVERFKDLLSYTEVTAIVETPQRTYVKRTSVQRALSSLIGLLMATSPCPGMAFLKPLARFHLPFASREETLFRVVGAYLFGQYLLLHRGKTCDLELRKLHEAYARVHVINLGLAQRLRNVSGGDANVNAVVLLDLLAQEFPPAIKERMEEMAYLFSEYTLGE